MTSHDTEGGGYFATDREAADELSRLRLLEQINDPYTFRHLDAIGVAEGWRCLEVGAGAGSVVRWLSERIGPTGKVVAADLDPRFLGHINAGNVQVRHCDITKDPIDHSSYDLVHSRALLTHMQDPVAVLRRMVEALRPSGWMVMEDPDYAAFEAASTTHPCAEAFDLCTQARIAFLSRAKVMYLRYGHSLPIQMEELKLSESGNEAVAIFQRGRSPLSQMLLKTFQPIDAAMVASGVVTESDVSNAQRALDDPAFIYRSGLMVSVWGRKAA